MNTPYDLPDSDLQRFWSKVALPDAKGCMLWLGSFSANGYGKVSTSRLRPPPRTTLRAHRASLFLAEGPPPTDDHVAAHSCRNRHCVAPAHLRWATQSENLADRITDGTHVAGEGNHEARLTWEQVRRIRQLAAAGKSRREIAAEFSLSKAHLRRIVVGESWREVAS